MGFTSVDKKFSSSQQFQSPMHSPVPTTLLSIHQFLPLSHAPTSFLNSPMHQPVSSTPPCIYQFLPLSHTSTSFFHSPVHPPVSSTPPYVRQCLPLSRSLTSASEEFFLEFCTQIALSEPYLRYVLWVEIPCFRQIC